MNKTFNKDSKKEAVVNQWEQVCFLLRSEVGEENFNSWLAPMSPDVLESGEINLYVPTNFIKDWVKKNYADRIKDLWESINPEIESINFVVRPRFMNKRINPQQTMTTKVSATPKKEKPAPKAIKEKSSQPSSISYKEVSNISSSLDKRLTFDNFVVGKPNEFAYAAARRIAEQDEVSFNPLYLYSGVGLGKTHLMHAIALHIREIDPKRTVVYMSAENFMYRFVSALRYKNMPSFKEQFRSIDVLMIDDIQFISGKDATQEEFFHTFNSLIDQGKQIVVSADKTPTELEDIEDRLTSRLSCGLIADIHQTSYELRLGILESKAANFGADIPAKVLEFLAYKITSNIRELEGALRRVVAHSQMLGTEITLDRTRDILSDLLRSYDRKITIEEIQKKVAEHFNIKFSEMSSARRARSIARPRQIAMYLAKRLTPTSLPAIGKKFGGRDHTTVMYAVSKVEELCKKDSAFAEEVEMLKRILGN